MAIMSVLADMGEGGGDVASKGDIKPGLLLIHSVFRLLLISGYSPEPLA